eukprot:CAMPEP_0114632096 /NCGR_PEP_ID=MMETSP0168-20121206/14752_1 /TAXON_ID=95228 ORGANISM="Vannella sp., Strain DIVA3 517/6/12" /NCGR_SAMPLE_ID=MMETSP0168 /ASSEMBLY_ACC=CAM_ASM_000044 /LENGTH=597 /DNA_ID=CAMNT_0001843683 /DNA_START=37 /DNA_END=1828 /DNA_ORIENTATION=+
MRVGTAVLVAVCLFVGCAFACTANPNPQTTPLPLTNWRATSPWGAANWVPSGNSVEQTNNSEPTAFVSDFDGSLGQVIKGTISVETTVDDDFLGFIFGLDCSPAPSAPITSCSGNGLLFDWKRQAQYTAPAGTQLSSFTSWSNVVPPRDLWDKVGSVTPLVRGNNFGNTGWVAFTDYDFVSSFTRNRIQVWIDLQLEIDFSGTFSLGRNGFYGYSQQNTVYRDVQIVEAVGTHQCSLAPVGYTFDFTHTSCSPSDLSLNVIWDRDDPSEGMTTYTSPTTLTGSSGSFDISNVYNNPGAHIFRMQLLDNGIAAGPVIEDFALVRDPVDVAITKTPDSGAFCGFDSRCDAPTAMIDFSTSEGGTPTYTALWNDGDTTCCSAGSCGTCDDTRFVGAGSYSVSLIDSQSCTAASNSVTVTESVVSSLTFSEPTCGNLNTFVSGNCPGYTYAWSTVDGCSGCLTPGASTQSGLSPGTYDLTVTDRNGCTRSASYMTSYRITSPAADDEVVYMYLPRTWSWEGFQAGTTGDVVLEHTASSRRVTIFSGDVSSTTSVDYNIHMFEPGSVIMRFESSGSSSCFVERRFYLCASNHTSDPICDEAE